MKISQNVLGGHFLDSHCRSIFNHCDVIALKSYWFRWNNAK